MAAGARKTRGEKTWCKNDENTESEIGAKKMTEKTREIN
jgi:hypothetical protein